MNRKYLIAFLVVLLTMSFNSSVQGVDEVIDSTGDELVTDYDIYSVKSLVYPPSSIQSGVKAADFLKVGLTMNSGDNLPGIVVIEFDVDNDLATGGDSSLCGVFNSCAVGTKLKVQPGTDIAIVLMLREQGDDAPTAWCSNCYGGETCVTRDGACSGCDKTGCYTPSSLCNPGDPGCYALGEGCSCNETDCYVLDTLCADDTPCNDGRMTGEWYATVAGAGAMVVDQGRIEMPLPHGTSAEEERDCYKFPWARIVQAAYDGLAGNPEQFDFTTATNDPPKFQLSTWYDPDFATTENDFLNTSLLCAEVTDVVPNTGLADAVLGNEICEGNFDEDAFVDANDVIVFLENHGRHRFSTPCPSCKTATRTVEPGGDTLVSGYDISEAAVLAFPPSSVITGSKPEDFIKVSLKMDNKLPGIVVMEFDVDNDTGTGGESSLCGVLDSCAVGTKLKVQQGIDIALVMALREQGDDALTAWCYQCYASGTCATRDLACNNCDQANCYTVSSSCNPDDPDCYVVGEACSSCDEGDCYVLDTPCVDVPCGAGRMIGEWYAIASAAGEFGETMVDQGRIEMPSPLATDADLEDCYALPWARVVLAAYATLTGNPKQFDLAKAADSSHLRFQVSTWYDPDFATTKNDFLNTSSLCAEVTDVVPNTGLSNASQGNEICEGNFDEDRDVDGGDTMKFLDEFGRNPFDNPCPSCF